MAKKKHKDDSVYIMLDTPQHQINLSERDWDAFISLISSDVEPTSDALEAAERFILGRDFRIPTP